MTQYTNTTLNYPITLPTAIKRVKATRAPTGNDRHNFVLGDLWLNINAKQWWILSGLSNTTATWTTFAAAGAGVQTLTGNSGGPVGVDAMQNINIVGTSPINISGNPATFTLTVGTDGKAATSFVEDAGAAVPLAGIINVLGGTGISTVGDNGHTITINTTSAVPLQFNEDSGHAIPASNALSIVGGAGISTSGAGHTVTITAGSTVPTTFTEDSGTATPSGNNINFVGGSGIATSGAGSTVTITALAPTNLTFSENSGTAIPAANTIHVVGTSTNGINTTGAGSTVTVAMQSPYADGDFDFKSTVSGATRTLTVENTSNTASSQAAVNHKIAGTSAGDTWSQYTLGSSRSWALGLNNASNSALSISTNNSGSVQPSTGTLVWNMTTGGQNTKPKQSAFRAYNSTDENSVTGDSTLYTILFDSTDFDQNSDFNTGTSTFTAPVTGIYMLGARCYVTGVTTSHTNGGFQMNISSGNQFFNQFNFANAQPIPNVSTNPLGTSFSHLFSLSAGDTVQLQIQVSGGTKIINVLGGKSGNNVLGKGVSFWGCLIC